MCAYIWRQALAGRIPNLDALTDTFANDLVGIHELQEAETVVGNRVDKNIHIRAMPRLVARVRPEQIESCTLVARNVGSASFSLAITSFRRMNSFRRKRDERAPLHPNTSSASASTCGGMVNPSAAAVLRLIAR